MIPANSRSCSSSRNIKEFQRDLRFSHSLSGFIHHSSKINFVFLRKEQVVTNHQTQLFTINHKSPQCQEKGGISKTIISTADFNRWTPLFSMPFAMHACQTWVPRHFTCYNAAPPPPTTSTRAVTCRRRQKMPLDGARDLLSQIG